LITADGEKYVLELKVWANEQPEQISRYQDYLESEGYSRENIFFLTPDIRPSLTGNAKNITLLNEVKRSLEKIINLREGQGKTAYCVILKQYIDIIDKLTGVKSFMGIENSILKSEEDFRAVSILVNRRQEALTSLMSEFFSILENELHTGFHIDGYPQAEIVDYSYARGEIQKYYKSKNRAWPLLAFEIDSGLPEHEDEGLYFFVEIEDNLYAGMSPRKKGSKLTKVDIGDYYESMKGNQVTKVFLEWEHITLNGNLIDFTINGLSKNESFLKQLLLPGTLQFDMDKMHQLVKQIRQLYCKQCRIIFKL